MTQGRLNGKVAMVTGAASGMGWAIASVFAAEGATTYLVDRADTVTSRADELGQGSVGIRADVTSATDMSRTMQQVVTEQGRVDVLCNNAGIHGAALQLAAMPEEAFDELIAVNLKGVFLGMREALPIMARQKRGSIINTASMAGNRGIAPRTTVYAATKAAVVALTRGAAIEYGPAGIRVNAICPGVIQTPMQNPSIAERVTSATPLRRLGEADDIARVALFLASDDSAFLTGEAIGVDGGITLKLPVTSGDEMWSEPGWDVKQYR